MMLHKNWRHKAINTRSEEVSKGQRIRLFRRSREDEVRRYERGRLSPNGKGHACYVLFRLIRRSRGRNTSHRRYYSAL